MPRVILNTVVILLIGVIINIAVAWGCALWSRFDPDRSWSRWSDVYPRITLWLIDADGGTGITRIRSTLSNSGGSFHGQPMRKEAVPAWARREIRFAEFRWDGEPVEDLLYASGWPFRCFYCRFDPTADGRVAGGIRLDGRAIDRSWPRSTQLLAAIPRRPLWPEFAFNALIFTAVIAMPFIVRTTFRWVRRKPAGRCVECGYDLRGTDHEQCPECGRST